METLRWVLASQSPRRQQLMRLFGRPFEVHPAQIEEHLPEYSARPDLLGKRLAKAKAEAVAPCYADALIIAADTLVVIDRRVLGKPADESEALEMLRLLSGRTHTVITALCLMLRRGGRTVQTVQDAPRSRVTFRPLNDAWLRWYIATGEPFDKAGAYGIQEYGALLIDKVQGCYFNVVGLPLATLTQRLEELGVWRPTHESDGTEVAVVSSGARCCAEEKP
ncbi:MAG: Maf-like protein [Fimbriimonadales bacterium]|nr:MAG: Maf-like protein [Fimbriimonadales bacterium]